MKLAIAFVFLWAPLAVAQPANIVTGADCDSPAPIPVAASQGQKLSPTSGDWRNVAALQTGRRVTVFLQPKGARNEKIAGTFHSSTADSISLRLKEGLLHEIPRSDVTKIVARRQSMRRAKWIGMGVGAASFFGWQALANDHFDFNAKGKTAWTAIGAGLGFVGGYVVGLFGRNELTFDVNVSK